MTGISGFLKNLISVNAPLKNPSRTSSFLFISGMVCGGGVASKYLNAAFEDWSTLPIARLVMGGLLG